MIIKLQKYDLEGAYTLGELYSVADLLFQESFLHCGTRKDFGNGKESIE